jgi:hypothetical protein
MSDKYGNQFDESRFKFGGSDDSVIKNTLEQFFDARNVAGVEPDEAYDNFADEKAIHQIIDYTGIDYLIDPFDRAAFGVNHRTHSQTDATLRFDIRSNTGTTSPSELEKLQKSEGFDIVPKYASRMKRGDGDYEWFKIIDLYGFVEALDDGLTHSKKWDDGDVTALMFDYSDLHNRGLVTERFK